MATHSSILAWRLLRTEEPGRLHFIGSHRVGHSCRNLARMHALKLITETCTLKSTQNLRVLTDEPSQSEFTCVSIWWSLVQHYDCGLFIFSAAF